MHPATGRLVRAIALGALLVVGQAGSSIVQPGLAGHAMAASSPAASLSPHATPPVGSTLTAKPSIIGASVKVGTTGTSKVTLTSGISQDVTIVPDGLGQQADGGFQALVEAKDGSPYTARPFLTVTPSAFHMDAGESRDITVKISVPAGAGVGTRYAIIEVLGRQAGASANVGIGVALGLSVVVTLASTTQTRTGAFQDVSVAAPAPNQPLALTATLDNTGNTHYGAPPYAVSTLASLQSSTGDVLATADSTIAGNSIIPTFGRAIALSLAPSQRLADGRYHVELEARLQDGTLLAQAALDVDIAGGAVLGEIGGPSTGVATPATSGPPILVVVVLSALFGGLAVGLLVVSRRKLRRVREKAGAAR